MTYDAFLDAFNYVGNDIAHLLENEKTESFHPYNNAYSLRYLTDYYLSLNTAERETFAKELGEIQQYNDYVADSGVYTSLTQDNVLNKKLHDLALEIIYSEPLPETGLIQKIDGEELDFTDILARRAMQYTVGDVVDTLYATDDGKVYAYYGSGDFDVEDHDDIEYMWNADVIADPDAIEDDDLRTSLDELAEEMLSQPFIVAREVRGTDNSLIDVEYDVTNPAAFHAFLRGQADGMEYNASLYYTEFARRIAKYLSDNMVYTLNPTAPDTEDTMSSVERFLFVTKEGYCVQYATAATLLLRSVGVPTRYVEGYIAPKFARNEAEDRVGNYLCNVKDFNAHAWCEIYLENYGWLTAEVTSPYYSEMYDPYETINYNRGDSSSDILPETPVTEEIEEEEEEDTLWDL